MKIGKNLAQFVSLEEKYVEREKLTPFFNGIESQGIAEE